MTRRSGRSLTGFGGFDCKVNPMTDIPLEPNGKDSGRLNRFLPLEKDIWHENSVLMGTGRAAMICYPQTARHSSPTTDICTQKMPPEPCNWGDGTWTIPSSSEPVGVLLTVGKKGGGIK